MGGLPGSSGHPEDLGGRRAQNLEQRPVELLEAQSVNGKHRVRTTMVYDFRHCKRSSLPKGVHVVSPCAPDANENTRELEEGQPQPGAHWELEQQSDKSTALKLTSRQYLELDLADAPPDGSCRGRSRSRRRIHHHDGPEARRAESYLSSAHQTMVARKFAKSIAMEASPMPSSGRQTRR